MYIIYFDEDFSLGKQMIYFILEWDQTFNSQWDPIFRLYNNLKSSKNIVLLATIKSAICHKSLVELGHSSSKIIIAVSKMITCKISRSYLVIFINMIRAKHSLNVASSNVHLWDCK